MKERPILMSAPMVVAALADAKTQTRRVAKGYRDSDQILPQQEWHSRAMSGFDPYGFRPSGGLTLEDEVKRCPYGVPGDQLWVRETWAANQPRFDRVMPSKIPVGEHVIYRASSSEMLTAGFVWRPSIFLPRWASRLTLEITEIRLHRIQEISETDALAEGISTGRIPVDDYGPERIGYAPGLDDGKCTLYPSPTEAFRVLWNEINAKRGYDWASNPWVFAVSFRRIK